VRPPFERSDWRLKCSVSYGRKIFQEGYSVAKERNNIYAITADAVDLALDTAGAIGSMVGGVAHAVGLGSGKDKSDDQERREADDAAQRVSNSLRQEAEAVKPRSHASKSHKTRTTKHASAKHTSAKRAATKHVKKATKRKTARKVA
jgi:hypothetical protein